MALPTCPLGSSGFHITTVGFGSWAIGGGGWAFGWGPQDDAESVATMRHALELGVNWIDTAAVYGLGHSEEVVGKLLREVPASSNRPLIFTKCGLTWDVQNPMQAAKTHPEAGNHSAGMRSVASRLGVERIDLYQFHWPDETGTPVEDSWAAMVKLVEEGKVRATGVSNFNVDLLERCEAIRHVDSLQPPFSMINRAAGDKLLPWCKTSEHRRHLLQPDAVRNFDGCDFRRPRGKNGQTTIGGGVAANFKNRNSAVILRCATRCVRSRRGTVCRSHR